MNRIALLLGTILLIDSGIAYGDSRPSDVVINEIMQNPAHVSDTHGEWFEVFNRTRGEIDINGWVIRDNDDDYHLIDNGSSLIVPPRGYLVLGRNADTTANGGYQCDYQYDEFVLGNGGDEIFLIDGTTIIDSVIYDDGTSFPDPVGASMELKNPQYDNELGTNWGEADTTFGLGDGGSPGGRNSIYESIVDEYEPTPEVPPPFLLSQNYPNPFNAETEIRFALPRACHVELEVYNLLGQRVLTLVDGHQRAGYQRVQWDGRDDRGLDATTGVYLCRLSAGGLQSVKPMMLLR